MDTGGSLEERLERRVLELEEQLRVTQLELRNAREIINDSDPDFYGDDLPPELEDENDFNEEIGNAL